LDFNQLSKIAEKDNVPEAISWMCVALTGLAHVWYTSLDAPVLTDYKTFVTTFRNFFGRKDTSQWLADFHSRVQTPTESVVQFFLALQKLVQRTSGKLRPSDLKHQFEEGLRPLLKIFVLQNTPKTAKEALDLAQRQELVLKRAHGSENINVITPAPTTPTAEAITFQ